MCCDASNRARCSMPGGGRLVVAGLRCMCVRHLFRSYLQPPPHLLFLLSAGLRVTVGAATDPYYHPRVLTSPPFRHLLCLQHYGASPAATDLVVLLRSYLQPPPPPAAAALGPHPGRCRCSSPRATKGWRLSFNRLKCSVSFRHIALISTIGYGSIAPHRSSLLSPFSRHRSLFRHCDQRGKC
jgi:hypothetical protein